MITIFIGKPPCTECGGIAARNGFRHNTGCLALERRPIEAEQKRIKDEQKRKIDIKEKQERIQQSIPLIDNCPKCGGKNYNNEGYLHTPKCRIWHVYRLQFCPGCGGINFNRGYRHTNDCAIKKSIYSNTKLKYRIKYGINTDQQIKRSRIQIQKRKECNEFLFYMKSKSPCKLCLESNPAVIDFHHRDSEQKDLSGQTGQGIS